MPNAAHSHLSPDPLARLRLLHLADSALPIGALAHSFGIETLAAEGLLSVADLPEFFRGYLEEAGMIEAVFCRAAFRLACSGRARGEFAVAVWRELNERLNAFKAAREARAGSATLGRNFILAVLALGNFPLLREALEAMRGSASGIHHGPAFGLAGGALDLEEDSVVLAYLHQSMAGAVSACQRLLPLGQTEATRILWDLKPAIAATAAASAACEPSDACCFMPLLDVGAMEHPALRTRLFVS